MEIQLVIRVPYQNIEDQIIKCSDDWTILRLKEHLSKVYPHKPAVWDQKIIYSGQLLQDYLQLKHVIRIANNESNVHIFHLVYTPAKEAESNTTASSQQTAHQEESAQTTEIMYPARNDVQPAAALNLLGVNNSQWMPYAFPSVYNDPQMLAQMAAVQQVYAQYLVQYWQSVFPAMSGNNTGLSVMPNPQAGQGSNSIAAQAPPQQLLDQRVDPEEDDFANQDWFELILQSCRIPFLLSFMYFYSTPDKFFIFMLCFIIMFLYQEGWFFTSTIDEFLSRIRRWANEEVVNLQANNANNQADTNNEEAQNGQELEAAMDGDNPPHVQNPDVINNNQQNSLLSIVVAFFFSLIPEAPPPVNLN